MPKTVVRTQPKRVTNADLKAGQVGLAAGITELRNEVVPRLDRIEDLAAKAGLNGFSGDIHAFFEQRAESVAARQWLSRRLRPLLKFKYVIAAVGFVSSLGWAILAIRQIITFMPHN